MYTLHYIYTYIDNQYCFALFCRRWGSTGQLTRNREEEPVRNWIMSMMTSDDWGCCISNMMIVTTVTNHWSVTGFNVIPSLKRRKPFDTLQTQHNFTRQTSPAAHTIQIYTDSCQRFNTGVHAFTRTVVHWVTDWQQWCIVWHCDRHPANLAFCYHFNGRACTCVHMHHLTLDTAPLGEPQPGQPSAQRWQSCQPEISADTCVNNPLGSHRRPEWPDTKYLLVSVNANLIKFASQKNIYYVSPSGRTGGDMLIHCCPRARGQYIYHIKL